MINAKDIAGILDGYDTLRIGVLGSHSALEIMDGAKDEGFETVVFCQKGRDGPYRLFERIADDIVVLDRFSDMAGARMQKMMRDTGTVIVPHRSFAVYLGYDRIEKRFRVPVFGNRRLLRAEERDEPENQYYLLKKAGIRYPRIYSDPRDIDRPCIVKVQESRRKLERAFFVATSYQDYVQKASERLSARLISRQGLRRAVIEELAIGTYMNFNYFYTPVSDVVDFMGIERRLQTNIHDYNALPARQQLEIDLQLQNIEVGHTPASIRESLLEQVIKMGQRFVRACKSVYPPGMIGPFSLQSVITRDLDIIVYDVSLRVPGNPILATTTPYTKYRYGQTFGVGRRIAMEIDQAQQQDRLGEIFT